MCLLGIKVQTCISLERRCSECGIYIKFEGPRCPCCKLPLRSKKRNYTKFSTFSLDGRSNNKNYLTNGSTSTMFTSVTERTREIGIMKAIGARNSTILALFLVEALIIGLLGAVIGSLVGVMH